MTGEPKKRRGLAESFDPYMLRDGFTTAALEPLEPLEPTPKTSPVVFNTLSETPRFKDMMRQPSMVLRSRSAKNMAEQSGLKHGMSSSGKTVRHDDDSKSKPTMCKSRIFVFAVVLWCLVVVIVLHSIPWEDFEIRWVRKTISDVQWLYPLSRDECTAGQAMLRPVATCGLPQLANAKFMQGARGSSKRRRYQHSPSFLEALRIIQPSRDYTHVYEFIANGSLVPLPAEHTAKSQAVQQEVEQPKEAVRETEPTSSQTVPLDDSTEVSPPPQISHALPANPLQTTNPQVTEGVAGSHAQVSPQVGDGSLGPNTSIGINKIPEAQNSTAVDAAQSNSVNATAQIPHKGPLNQTKEGSSQQPGGTTASQQMQLPTSQVGSAQSTQNKSHPIMDSVNSMDFAFKRFKPASLGHDSVVWCEGSNEPATEHMNPVKVHQPVLFVLGAQHAGVDWLAKSLANHPAFAAPVHSYKQPFGNSTNQLHFFNRWPMPPPDAFIDSFPTTSIVRNPNRHAEVALFDATPDYLFNSVAAPRIKALLPQARFVVILRDPVARAYIAWKKAYDVTCPPGTVACTMPSFAASVKNSIAAGKARDCLFNAPSASRTWHTCFQCHFSRRDDDACHSTMNSKGHMAPFCLGQRQFNIVDVGNYAAQLAWWFSFFRPRQFLFISHSELQHQEGRSEVLKLVAEHVGLEQAEFSPNMLASFIEPHLSLTVEDTAAALNLRRLYDKSEEDLYKLLALHGKLGAEFSGLPSEL